MDGDGDGTEVEGEDISTGELTLSYWGLPLNWDGSGPVEKLLYVDKFSDITEHGWDFLYKTRFLNWAIMSLEKN